MAHLVQVDGVNVSYCSVNISTLNRYYTYLHTYLNCYALLTSLSHSHFNHNAVVLLRNCTRSDKLDSEPTDEAHCIGIVDFSKFRGSIMENKSFGKKENVD